MSDALKSDALKAREALRAALHQLDINVSIARRDHPEGPIIDGKRLNVDALPHSQEILAGHVKDRINEALAALSALVPDEVAGVEPAAWRWRPQGGTVWVMWEAKPVPGDNLVEDAVVEVEPLYSATALERVVSERDEAVNDALTAEAELRIVKKRAESAEAKSEPLPTGRPMEWFREREEAQRRLAAWDINSLPRDMSLLDIVDARIDDLRKFMDRAETAEAKLVETQTELSALRARLEEAGKVVNDGAEATTHALMILPQPELGRHKRAWSSLIDWRDAARRFLEEAK